MAGLAKLTQKQKIFCTEYAIDDLGQIYSIPRINSANKPIGGIYIKQQLSNSGYLTASLTIEGKKRRLNVHRIVAEVFILNPNNFPEVNHINGIKTDNSAVNLEWTNRKENIKHYWNLIGREKPRSRKQQINTLLLNYRKRVLDSRLTAQIDELKGTLSQAEIARKIKVSPQTVMRYIKGQYAF